MQGCCIRENGVDNRPRSFHSVFANEQHAISTHRIPQQALIRVNLVRGGLLDRRKMRGLGDKFFAGAFHSGAEAQRYFSWTEAKAEVIARFVPQNVERRLSEFDQHFGSRNRQALSGANQKWDASTTAMTELPGVQRQTSPPWNQLRLLSFVAIELASTR